VEERAREDTERFVHQLIGLRSGAELQRSGLVADSSHAERIARDLAPLWVAPGLRVERIRVNGPRVDVRVYAADGRAWLAVMWMTPTALRALELYERPHPFPGRQPGTVVVLNGPSSVGKSALMAAFADAAETPWACFDEPILGRLPTKFLAWLESAGPVAEGFLAGLASAARAGNQLIVSTGGIAQQLFRDALAGIPTVYVGLHAPLAVLVERQLSQADKFGGLAEASISIHDGWAYDLDLDTVALRPPEAARVLQQFLESAPA
jgi:chloramphenicol 3-O phosphotransferase